MQLRQRFADLRRRLWCVQAGTAVSSRIRAGVPNSVNLVRFDRAAFSWPKDIVPTIGQRLSYDVGTNNQLSCALNLQTI